jgi:hypothetical protein
VPSNIRKPPLLKGAQMSVEKPTRDEENKTRHQRMAGLKRGPGKFKYVGGLFDTEAKPTILTYGRNVMDMDEAGLPKLDASGRPMTKKLGTPILDHEGKPQLGGVPVLKKTKLETVKVRGVEFAKGTVVEVDASLALKLRCMQGFAEVEEKAEKPKS